MHPAKLKLLLTWTVHFFTPQKSNTDNTTNQWKPAASARSELNSLPLQTISSSLNLVLLWPRLLLGLVYIFLLRPEILCHKCICLRYILPDPYSLQWFRFWADIIIEPVLPPTLFFLKQNQAVIHCSFTQFWVTTLHLVFVCLASQHRTQPYESFWQVCHHSCFLVYLTETLCKNWCAKEECKMS